MRVRDKKGQIVRIDDTENKLFMHARGLIFDDYNMSFNQLVHSMLRVCFMNYLHMDFKLTITDEELLILVENSIINNRKKQIKLFGIEQSKKMIDSMKSTENNSFELYNAELFELALKKYKEEK